MRIVSTLLAVLCATSAFAQYDATITVSRVLVDVRVTKYDGTPVTDLTPDDFTIEIDGEPARTASVTWNGARDGETPGETTTERATGASAVAPATIPSAAEPRTIVLFIQTDFQRANVRMSGQMKFRRYAEELVQSFAPEDRIAVFSFDSHLKFRSDLTVDRDATIAAIRESILIDHPPPPVAVPEPSLATQIERSSLTRAANSEEGLTVVANALAALPGAKTVLLVGWGLGERMRGAINMKYEWTEARRALDAARATMIAIDFTQADGHDLAAGMAAGAVQTGGFYIATNVVPQIAVNRVRNTLRGHYELELVPAKPLPPGTFRLQVRVKRKSAIVLAPSSVTIAN
ncbi:MAG TPA: VWA domain-containing protein [Thermoanaerobaculia bacterium]|nr:VWA domain-containing protein [Thermoanaerobaculia bacterium]